MVRGSIFYTSSENKKRTFLHVPSDIISSKMHESPPDPMAFTPVPCVRHDGWTPERQRAFIHILARIGLVSAAARDVGMSRKSAYALLARAGPESGFAAAWEEALRRGKASALSHAVGRAIEGVEVPYFYGGRQRGTRRIYNDSLLIAALRHFWRDGDRG